MHGQGTFIHVNGYKYEGIYANNKFDRFGKETLTDNTIYEGEYLDGRRHG